MEEKEWIMLSARIEDQIISAIINHRITNTPFLDPAAQKRTIDLLTDVSDLYYCKFGGYTEAERCLLVFYQSYMKPPSAEDYISAVRIRWNNQYDRVSHRDVLGSVLALGIKRETIGDIIIAGNTAQVITTNDLAPFIADNLIKTGRAPVKAEVIDCNSLTIPTPRIKNINTTLSSMRLDSVLSSGFGFSRSKGLIYIRGGKVFVNWQRVEKPDHRLNEGDLISLRGFGRVKVSEIIGNTKKNRINVLLQRFL